MPPVTSEQLEILLEANKNAASSYAALSTDLHNLTNEVRWNHRAIIVIFTTLLTGVLAATGYYKEVSLPAAIQAAQEPK